MAEAADETIAIVGGGIVGCALALSLAQQNRSVVLIERREPHWHRGALGFDVRTVALSPLNQRWLCELTGENSEHTGLVGCDYQHMVVWESEGTASINFSAQHIGQPALGSIHEHSQLSETLWLRARQDPRISCRAPAEVVKLSSAAPSLIQLNDNSELSVALVIAADGAHSQIRDRLGIAMRSHGSGERAIATIAQTADTHANTAWQVFCEGQPLALLPLPDRDGKHFVSIVWSLPETQANYWRDCPADEFIKALEQRSEQRLGSVLAIDARLSFPLSQQHAQSYVAASTATCGPGVLVGDAAHVVHPLAGQGVNLGLRDARILTEELRRAATPLSADPALSNKALKRYEVRARAANQLAIHSISTLGQMFGNRGTLASPWLQLLRNQGLRFANQQQWLKQLMMREALGEGWITG